MAQPTPSYDQEMFKQNQLLVAQNLRASHKIITKLEKSKASTETMVDRLPDSYFIVDTHGRILKGNTAAANMLSLEMDELINQSISKLFTKESWNIFENKMKRLISKNAGLGQTDKHAIPKDESFELIIDAEGLERRSYHWNLRLFEGISARRGQLICAFGRDITQIRQYEQQLGQIFSVIPLGIATTDEKGCIRGPYSAYTEYLLDVKTLDGANFFDCVFGQSLPYMSKMEQTGISELREIFGQEQLWFDLSKKRFPSEIFYPLANGDGRWLGITYHPIIADDIIVKMLMVLDDRTEIVKARKAKESLRQKENIMIQRIMDIQRCDEETLISSYEDLDSMLIRMESAVRENDVRSFCNILHGIKGVVRTAGFSNFKEIAHDSEDTILKLIQEKKPVEQKLLDSVFNLVNAEWQELIKLRKMQTSGNEDVSSYQNFMQKSLTLNKLLADFEAVLPKLTASSKDKFEGLKNGIRNLTSLPLSFIEAKLTGRGKKTAAYLGKKVNLSFDWDDIYLDEKVLSRLNEVLLHLVNNAIDHGIESPDERKKKGKPESGQIFIKATKKAKHIEFEFEDDGAGIEIKDLKKALIEKRMTDEKTLNKMNEHDIIQMIFKSGFSTAATITDISGRGIGLDSVFQIILKLSGKPIDASRREPYGMKFSFLLKYE